MIKTTLANRRAVSQIVKDYRVLAGTSQREAPLRVFAASLSDPESYEPVTEIGRRAVEAHREAAVLKGKG